MTSLSYAITLCFCHTVVNVIMVDDVCSCAVRKKQMNEYKLEGVAKIAHWSLRV